MLLFAGALGSSHTVSLHLRCLLAGEVLQPKLSLPRPRLPLPRLSTHANVDANVIETPMLGGVLRKLFVIHSPFADELCHYFDPPNPPPQENITKTNRPTVFVSTYFSKWCRRYNPPPPSLSRF